VSEDFNEDLFIHYSAINIEGYKTLKAGQTVTFDVEPGERGLHAIEINPTDAGKEDAQISTPNIQSA
jgi:CspA family cold shock protein